MLVDIALLVLCITSGLLVVHCKYDDGFFGRIALGVIFIVSLIVLIGDADEMIATGETTYDFTLETTSLVCAFALFLLRHTWRFWVRRNFREDA